MRNRAKSNSRLSPIISDEIKLYYTTRFGKAFCGDSIDLLRSYSSNSVNLVITSPPFALQRQKKYGNVTAEKYIKWFLPFAEEIFRILKPDGSFVLDIGGTWKKGEPTRSLYHFELLLALCDKANFFKLAQEFYWYNPAKLPAPAEWVTIERVRVKDAVNPIWWLSKSANPKASNKEVLTEYKDSMKRLLEKGYNSGPRPSEHVVSKKWNTDHGGAIPPNLIIAANTKSYDEYLKACRLHGLRIHPARFVDAVPEFFIKFLTSEKDIVLDPFAGSNVIGFISEQLKRRWIGIEINEEFVIGSFFRFDNGKPISDSLKKYLLRIKYLSKENRHKK